MPRDARRLTDHLRVSVCLLAHRLRGLSPGGLTVSVFLFVSSLTVSVSLFVSALTVPCRLWCVRIFWRRCGRSRRRRTEEIKVLSPGAAEIS